LSWLDWLRRPRLVPIAELADQSVADAAWERLQVAGIPASVETDPGMLGEPVVTRILVERPQVESAQRAIADLVRGS
jgi:hypothetical protein